MGKEDKKISISFFGSLRGRMLLYTVIPLVVLAVLVGIVGARSSESVMVSMIEEEMSEQCDYLESIMDATYPGDYSWEILSNDSFRLYKGDYEITTQNDIVDSLKEAFDNEFTIYLGQVSVLTSYTDSDGDRGILSEAPVVVRTSVIENGETKFYSNVMVGGENCFAYFRPIISESSVSYGMYAIYHSAAEINSRVRSVVIPLYIVCVIAAFLLGLFSVYYSQKIVNRILSIKNFTETVSSGNLSAHMNSSLTTGNDELASLAKSSVEMQKSMRDLIDYDALTGINNRRYANIYMGKMHDEAGLKADYCIAIGDIDFFKKVNDTYGHDAGDLVLKTVAGILHRNVPPKCMVARWGGEEFLFAFREMTLEESIEILTKCLLAIRDTTMEYNGQTIRVTMSFGVARAVKGKSVDAIVVEADDMLYESKEGGRNRITS